MICFSKHKDFAKQISLLLLRSTKKHIFSMFESLILTKEGEFLDYLDFGFNLGERTKKTTVILRLLRSSLCLLG